MHFVTLSQGELAAMLLGAFIIGGILGRWLSTL